MSESLAAATLGGGCFWCLEAVFEQLRGVERVESGFAGGAAGRAPSYEEVCAGTTGHAEVVQVHFRPSEIRFRDLLDVFFTIHDPTTLNRQGPDVGTQYRSVIFSHDAEQAAEARAAIARLMEAGTWGAPIVTQVVPLPAFYPAAAYHQGYFQRTASNPYCSAVVAPKVAKARSRFIAQWKRA